MDIKWTINVHVSQKSGVSAKVKDLDTLFDDILRTLLGVNCYLGQLQPIYTYITAYTN